MLEEDRRVGMLRELGAYRSSMTEFSEEEMDYLIFLVGEDIRVSPDRRII